ncbi:pseudouridine synthase [Azonexus sp.]|uniref:pseudouridine synthase n=1 Tax=Azonexus sp. TaxID=1872668 RepID=UPI0035ADCD12
MSDTNKPPEDPWAKWRRPAAVDASPAPETVTPKPAAEVPAPAAAEPSVPESLAGRTLGVRKVEKKPARPERPARPGGKPVGPRDARGGDKAGRRDERPAGKSAGGKPSAKPWSKPSGDRPASPSSPRGGEPRRENPWAKAAAPRPAEARPAPAAAVPAQPAGEAPSGVRLSKVMSERGLCSRREADLWIERGWVFVDGVQVAELGSRIDPSAEITVSTEAKKDQAKAVTILLHKPVGYVSGQPEPGCTPAVTLIGTDNQVVQPGDPEFKPWMLRGLAPAGRLDVDSTGLLVLTSDGRVAKKLIGDDSQTEKEYLVRVSGQMIAGGLELLRHGLELDGKALKPAWIKQLNEDQLHFILKEGKKRQIRRMCELVGLKVIGLKRVRIGRIRLGDLPLGQWRFLRADEAF